MATPPPTSKDSEHLPGRSFRHRFEGPFFRQLFIGGVRHIPSPIQRLTMPMWAGLFYGLVGDARRGAERNLTRVLGPIPTWRLKLRSYRLFINYAQTLTDTYAIHCGRRPLPTVSVGRHHLLDSLKRGKGVIAITGHLGMWQMGPFLAGWRDLPPFHMAMAEEPNPLVQQFEERFRSRFRIVYTTGSPFSSLQLVSVLRQGEIVGMQMDRHLGGQTVTLPFFGEMAHFTAGPATLARATGAELVPIFFMVEPSGSGMGRKVAHYIEEPIAVPHTSDRQADIMTATEKLVRVYERYVARYPEQWYNFHDFWEGPRAMRDGEVASPAKGALRAANVAPTYETGEDSQTPPKVLRRSGPER